MDIESEISELRKEDDYKGKIFQLNKLPKIQIQSVKTLYEVFKYNNGAHQFLHNSKEALYTAETELEAIFQNNFRNLQEKLNPKYKKQISSSSSKFKIKTTSDTEIQGNNLEELYGNFDKKLSGGFTEFSKEIDKGLLKTEYKNFFKRKILDLENSQNYDEISKFLSFYKKFHSLCHRYFTSKYSSENESTGSDLKAFDAMDKEVGIDDFRAKIVNNFMRDLSNAEDKEAKIKKFKNNITDEDTIKKFTEQLKKKLFKDLEKLSINEAKSDFFIMRKPEIEHVGITDFRKKVRNKIYKTKTKQMDPTKLFTAYSQSEIDLGSQKIFRGFVEDDKAKENLRRQLRDSLTPAKNLNQKFEDFLEDNSHLFFLKTINPLASTILSCVDHFGNLLGSSKPNNRVAPDNYGAVQNTNNLSNVGVNNRD